MTQQDIHDAQAIQRDWATNPRWSGIARDYTAEDVVKDSGVRDDDTTPPAPSAGSASSLFNILRNLGGAIGIALLATLLDSRAKVYFDYLREALVPTNPQVDERLAQLAAQLGSQQAALGKLSEITHQQAMIMAYNDAFHVIGMVLAVSMLAVLLTRSLPAGIGARADAGAH